MRIDTYRRKMKVCYFNCQLTCQLLLFFGLYLYELQVLFNMNNSMVSSTVFKFYVLKLIYSLGKRYST